jgi:gas vesicle protein
MADNRIGAFVGGVLVGTAIGTAVGLLLAPRTGRDTRRILRKSAKALPEVAEDVGSNLQYQTERLLDSAQKSLDETVLRLQEAMATGKEAMARKKQELTQQQTRSRLQVDLLDDAPDLETDPDPPIPESQQNQSTSPSQDPFEDIVD